MAGPRGHVLYRTRNRKTGRFHGKWRIRYRGPDGAWKHATGFVDKGETRRLAEQLAMRADEINRGIREAPKVADQESRRPLQEHVDAYLAWGAAQGGRGGRPWAPLHREYQERRLGDLVSALGLKTLRDVNLADVEKVLQGMHERGLSGKTINLHAMSLRSFVNWCRKRKLLEGDPLDGLRKYDGTARTERRDLMPDEVGRLLVAAPPERALLYRVALSTGFRAGELRSLRVGDLDAGAATLRLRAEHAKDRRDVVRPVPSDLVTDLAACAQGKTPEAILLPAILVADYLRNLYRDLKVAGITQRTFRGKVDFHALRVTYCNLVSDVGMDPKTTQELMRHKTPDQTMRIYAKRHDERLRTTTDALGQVLAEAERNARISRTGVERGVERLAVGAEGQCNFPPPLELAARGRKYPGSIGQRARSLIARWRCPFCPVFRGSEIRIS